MKRLTLLTLCLISLSSAAMTHYADGSIMLTPEEVANVDRNLNLLEEEMKKAEEVIEAQQRMINELKKGGRCI